MVSVRQAVGKRPRGGFKFGKYVLLQRHERASGSYRNPHYFMNFGRSWASGWLPSEETPTTHSLVLGSYSDVSMSLTPILLTSALDSPFDSCPPFSWIGFPSVGVTIKAFVSLTRSPGESSPDQTRYPLEDHWRSFKSPETYPIQGLSRVLPMKAINIYMGLARSTPLLTATIAPSCWYHTPQFHCSFPPLFHLPMVLHGLCYYGVPKIYN